DRDRGRAPRGLRAELAARQERSDLQLLGFLWPAARAVLRRRRDDVPRVPQEARASRSHGRKAGTGARVTMTRFSSHALPRRLAVTVAIALLAAAVPQANAQQQQRAAQQRPVQRGGETAGDLHWWPVRKNIWMLVGAGTNIAASVGPDGVLLVNAGT